MIPSEILVCKLWTTINFQLTLNCSGTPKVFPLRSDIRKYLVKGFHNLWWSPHFRQTFTIECVTQAIWSNSWPKPSTSFGSSSRHSTKPFSEGTLHDKQVVKSIVFYIFVCFDNFKNILCNIFPYMIWICRCASEGTWNRFSSNKPILFR